MRLHVIRRKRDAELWELPKTRTASIFFISAFFIFFVSSMYFSTSTNQDILLQSFLTFLIVILITSILILLFYPSVIKNTLSYLESTAYIEAIFYMFLIIVGSFQLKFLVPLGFDDKTGAVVLCLIIMFVLMTIFREALYLEKYFTDGATSEKFIAKSRYFM